MICDRSVTGPWLRRRAKAPRTGRAIDRTGTRNVALIIYITLCGLVAYGGRHRRIGFLGFFIACLLLTPLLILAILVLTAPPGKADTKA